MTVPEQQRVAYQVCVAMVQVGGQPRPGTTDNVLERTIREGGLVPAWTRDDEVQRLLDLGVIKVSS